MLVDLLQEVYGLKPKAKQFFQQMALMNMAGLNGKWQATDEIIEQIVRLVKHGTGHADSAASFNQSVLNLLGKDELDANFFDTFHVTYMRQHGKQRMLPDISLDVANVAAAVQPLVLSRGAPCTLGGVELLDSARTLSEEARSRVTAYQKTLKGMDHIFSSQAPVQLCKKPLLVDATRVAQQYNKSKRGKNSQDDFELSDDEVEVSIMLNHADPGFRRTLTHIC